MPAPPDVRLDADEVAARWPRLFHVTDARSWPLIERRGLLCTSALLDLFGVRGEMRERLEARKRPADVTLADPVLGEAVLRDNAPVNETVLRRTLDGVTQEQWYRDLNSRVYFWASRRRMQRLADNPRYRTRDQVVLVVDTARLLARHGDEVRLSAYNTGAVRSGAIRRGPGLHRRIGEYVPRTRSDLAEVTVTGAVRDLADLLVDVERLPPSE